MEDWNIAQKKYKKIEKKLSDKNNHTRVHHYRINRPLSIWWFCDHGACIFSRQQLFAPVRNCGGTDNRRNRTDVRTMDPGCADSGWLRNNDFVMNTTTPRAAAAAIAATSTTCRDISKPVHAEADRDCIVSRLYIFSRLCLCCFYHRHVPAQFTLVTQPSH